MSAEELGEGALLKSAFRDSQNSIDQGPVSDSDSNAVHLEKHESRSRAGSFVSVYKWMIPSDVEEVRCRHLKEIGMKVVDAGSRLRHSESGLEEAEIPDAFGAPVPCYLIVVNLQDLFKPEEDRRHRVNQRGASVHDGDVYSQSPASYETAPAAWRREPVQPLGTYRPWSGTGEYPR